MRRSYLGHLGRLDPVRNRVQVGGLLAVSETYHAERLPRRHTLG